MVYIVGDNGVSELSDLFKICLLYTSWGDVAALKDAFTGINIKLMKCTGMREAWKMVILAHAVGLSLIHI